MAHLSRASLQRGRQQQNTVIVLKIAWLLRDQLYLSYISLLGIWMWYNLSRNSCNLRSISCSVAVMCNCFSVPVDLRTIHSRVFALQLRYSNSDWRIWKWLSNDNLNRKKNHSIGRNKCDIKWIWMLRSRLGPSPIY